MNENTVRLATDGGVATITLDRPDAGNTVNVALARALMEAAIVCDEDPSIRCVVLTGAGKMFCAGGDLADFLAAGNDIPALLKELTAYLHMAVTRLAHMNKPLVTSVNGAAAGAGLSLAVLGDIVLAAASAKFALAYGNIGLSPDGGATWLLPRLIGLRRAQELCLTPRRLSADEAAAIGLISRVVPDAELAVETAALARTLAASAVRAVGRTRALLLSSFHTSLEAQLDLESRAIATSGRDGESREGVAAFVAKRSADFTSCG